MLYEYTSPWAGFKLTTLVMIDTDCIGIYKYNYHMTTAPKTLRVSECFLFNSNSALFQLYHGEYNLIFNEMMMRSALF